MVKSDSRKLIEDWLVTQYQVGTSAGGSDHLGSVELAILEFEIQTEGDRKIIDVVYEISVVTEFTYYPDNPPKYTKYSRRFVIDNSGKIKVHDAKTLDTNIDFVLTDFDSE